MAANTPHLVFDELVKGVNVEMVSIVEATAAEVSKAGLRKVGLLGTKSTMSKGFYQEAAARNGIIMIEPTEKDQDYVHDKYMGELVFRNIVPNTKTSLLDIVDQMKHQHQIEGIVLGGTELPLILQQEDFTSIQVFDTTHIHVNAILDRMLN